MTEKEYHDLEWDVSGICRNCLVVQFGVEPDATKYLCESCGERQVYGAQELLLMGEVEFVDDPDDSDLLW